MTEVAVLGEDEARRILERTLAMSDADETEVLLIGERRALTRFANNYVHQNVEETDSRLQVRVVLGKRVGVAATNRLDDDACRDLLERADELARHQVENPDFESLPAPTPPRSLEAFVDATARCGPEERASVAAAVCEASAAAGLNAAGACETSITEIAVANSHGASAYNAGTFAQASAVVRSDDSSGYADIAGIDATRIDGDALAREAIGRAQRSRSPVDLEPGEYDVVLEPYAVADILDWFAYLGFGAQAYHEQRSFMSGRLGQRILGENVTIVDDPLDLDSMPRPFDYEGVAKAPLTLVDAGVASAICYDSYYGAREGRPSTGHALPAGTTFGPFPTNLNLLPGDASIDDMIASTERGVLVTRFWYTRTVHPLTVVMTGMTRDGTWLIEDGRIASPIRNLRFTQSYVEAMNRVQSIGHDLKLEPAMIGASRVPALKIERWNFTGATEF